MNTDLETTTSDLVLRGEVVDLLSEPGRAFVIDLCRHEEGLEIASAEALEQKWKCDLQAVANNDALIQAVATELERRLWSGVSARELAAANLPEAVRVLAHMTKDRLEASARRIDAAKEIRAVASSGGDAVGMAGREHFTIIINTSLDQTAPPKVIEIKPSVPALEEPFQPITISRTSDDDPDGAPPTGE